MHAAGLKHARMVYNTRLHACVCSSHRMHLTRWSSTQVYALCGSWQAYIGEQMLAMADTPDFESMPAGCNMTEPALSEKENVKSDDLKSNESFLRERYEELIL